MQDEMEERESTQIEEEQDILTGDAARQSLESLGLDPEESQKVPDYDGTIKVFQEGDIVTGTVVKVDKDEVLLDIGYKSEGVIPSRELSIRYDVKTSEIVSPGDELEALVLQKEDKEGRLILSKKRAQYERAWGNIEKVKEEDGIVEGEVIEVVKGGLILDIGLRGFLPASLVEMRRVKDLSQYLGTKLEAKIIELDKNRNNVVLSRRSYLEKQRSNERREFLEQLEKGTKSKGSVSSIVNFGAFVDLGGVDGLIHISELSWSHVDHPSEVLSVGDDVEVEILDVDLERERVSLSLKKAQEDPWEKLSKEFPAGSTVHGRVTKLVPFGAFVEIMPGVEGLVHISELAWEHIEFPEEVVAVDEEIDAKIIDIDLSRRRVSLSIKQLTGPGEVEYVEYEEERMEEPQLVEADEYEEQASAGTGDEQEAGSEVIVPEPVETVEEVELGESEVVTPEETPVSVEPEPEPSEPEASIPEAEMEEPLLEGEPEPEPSEPEAAIPEAETPEESWSPEPGPAMAPPDEEPEPGQAADSEQGETAGGEEAGPEPEAAPVEEDGSLESILADMRKKGQQEPE